MLHRPLRAAALVVLFVSMFSSSQVAALSATTLTTSKAAASTTSTSSSSEVYKGLSSTPLVRASDYASVALPSLWRSNTPFGIADEVAVCAFLRHYG